MADGEHQEKPISLFYSYSHRDEALRGELEAHLSFLRRSKLIGEWHDRMIGAGDEWKGQIDRQLATADIILLLVSADFIASDYCWGDEMTKALARHQLGKARVIPVILRPCRWQSTPLSSLQAVPKDGRPVSEWPNHDAAFYEISAALERAIVDLQQQRRNAGEQTQEARTRAETKALQVAEEQQRDAEKRREQDEARRAAKADGSTPISGWTRNTGKTRSSIIISILALLFIISGLGYTFFERQYASWVLPVSQKHDHGPLMPDLDGKYTVVGKNTNGDSYRGEAEITHHEEIYNIRWNIGNNPPSYAGGRLVDKTLRINADNRIYEYELTPDGSLSGIWYEEGTETQGTETLKLTHNR